MKKLLLLALASLAFSACSEKGNDPQPNTPAAQTVALTMSVRFSGFASPPGGSLINAGLWETKAAAQTLQDGLAETSDQEVTLAGLKRGQKLWLAASAYGRLRPGQQVEVQLSTSGKPFFQTLTLTPSRQGTEVQEVTIP